MKRTTWLFIDKKNSFVNSNKLLKLKNMDQFSNKPLQNGKNYIDSHSKFYYWDSMYDVMQDDKFI